MHVHNHRTRNGRPQIKGPSGFMLLEFLLAIAIFSLSMAGIVWSLHKSSDLLDTVERKEWVQEQLEGALMEALKLDQDKDEFEEGKVYDLDQFGAQAEIIVEEVELESVNGELLKNFYEVTITISWIDEGESDSETLKTYHYWPLYQE